MLKLFKEKLDCLDGQRTRVLTHVNMNDLGIENTGDDLEELDYDMEG